MDIRTFRLEKRLLGLYKLFKAILNRAYAAKLFNVYLKVIKFFWAIFEHR